MPWNFPFWQALRFGVPSIIAGNVSILKHSNVVPQCAFAIEDIFRKSGFPENIFRTILSDHDSVFDLMASEIIKGISFTGSTNAGKKVAQAAGNNLKKVVMELGGSDPFIVLEDSDIEVAAKNAIIGRTMNTGQSCIASKRFIVVKDVAEEFASQFAKRMENLTVGDPMSEETDVGCLVNKAALEEIEEQVQDAVDKGATILTGGERVGNTGFFYKPTVLTDVNFQMKVVTEEVFGPVAPIIVVDNEDEAIEIANRTKFGLGGSVWTKDMERGLRIARKIEAGSVFVNSITKSDPRMPFGGVKESGFGRELSEFGLKEFVNVKGLNVYRQ
jgi:acyl-CoA reductase-like NAD-dependent aldehyde dehydrogenase